MDYLDLNDFERITGVSFEKQQEILNKVIEKEKEFHTSGNQCSVDSLCPSCVFTMFMRAYFDQQIEPTQSQDNNKLH